MIDNSSNDLSTGVEGNCDELLEQAQISCQALNLLRMEFPNHLYLLLPHLQSAWAGLESLVTMLADGKADSDSPERTLLNMVVERRGKAALFLDTLSQKKFSSNGDLSKQESSDLSEQVASLDKILNRIEVYMLRLKGWKPWYQRRWVQAALLLIFLCWSFGFVKERWQRLNRGYEVVKSVQDWGNLQIDRAVTGKSLKVDGHKCASGLGTHANSEITIRVTKKAKILKGSCGLDDGSGKAGSIQCEIRQEGRTLLKSEILRGERRFTNFSIPVQAELPLVLVVNNAGDGNGNDHADWCDLTAG